MNLVCFKNLKKKVFVAQGTKGNYGRDWKGAKVKLHKRL